MTRIAVVGGSGFIGSRIVTALRDRGLETSQLPAPRVKPEIVRAVRSGASLPSHLVRALSAALDGHSHVVNAAGVSDAAAGEVDVLDGANAIVPLIVQRASDQSGVGRFLHVSSSGVQGFARTLTEAEEVNPFSPYTRSKAWGEQLISGGPHTVVYRPTSVHGLGRTMTHRLVRLASSTRSVVAGEGALPTPQVLVDNVADGIAFTLLYDDDVPRVVLHPWEGLTTASLLSALGNREPRHVPMWMARSLVRGGLIAGARSPMVMASTRRFELLTMGQTQARGWLDETGWKPPLDLESWKELGQRVRSQRLA